jgi:hypothetical protein
MFSGGNLNCWNTGKKGPVFREPAGFAGGHRQSLYQDRVPQKLCREASKATDSFDRVSDKGPITHFWDKL